MPERGLRLFPRKDRPIDRQGDSFIFSGEQHGLGHLRCYYLVMVCFRISSSRLRKRAWITWWLLIGGVSGLSSCGLPAVSAPVAAPKPAPAVAPKPAPRPVLPEPSAPLSYPKKLSGIQFTIQVGAFSDTERAATLASELNLKGVDAYYFIDEDGLSKVRFEHFETRKAALRRAFQLQALGWIDDFITIGPVGLNHRIKPRISLGQKIVRTAGRFIGTAYRWGGESADAGFDCSGLTMTVYRLNGLDLPRNSRDQFRAGTPIKRSALKEGDLVFFATRRHSLRVSHVGIYTGGGRFIHAPGRGKSIRTASLSNGYFNLRFVGARRYF